MATLFKPEDEHEAIIVRRKDFYDGAEPSGNSAYAFATLRLVRLLNRPDLTERVETIFHHMHHHIPTQPMGFGRLLCALDFHRRPPQEIALNGQPQQSDFQRLQQNVYSHFLPDVVIAGATPAAIARLGAKIPLLAGRTALSGGATAYVCQKFSRSRFAMMRRAGLRIRLDTYSRNRDQLNFVCRLPVTDPDDLAALLI